MTAQLKSNIWQLQDAKAKFSEVIKSAAKSPQIITVRGEETAVILSMDKYRGLMGKRPSFIEALMNCPWPDVELELPDRKAEEWRDIEL
ncbi:prevent-host-death family protein [Treponema primitia ZAS-2]|uniref:Antitoxin n=1 Tax=Treponema primitia (strain ATCC BAA-887 / DSM 12427 / ZAS-2) TaxID=545694 RepID=F5YGU4_TREPZ|nr:type II toxin-antitoxin system Phd/YefM family antitoxin [Treponema primitia]AEF83572.1 prevent-host-death family protein [Treponema primitia ZAS-2]